MKVIAVELPKMLPYYFSEASIELLEEKIKESEVNIIGDEMHFYRENTIDLFNILTILKSKTEKVTAGNQCMYEYELDIHIHDGHIFKITLDDGNTYNTIVFHIGNLENSDLHIIHKIRK